MRPLLERTRSVAGTIPQQGSIRPPRVRKQRPRPAPEKYVTPSGPPDISCADIPEEQLSRTYSRSCVWDPLTNPVPPLQEMEGFGRFRRSVHADANWELMHFRGDLQTLGPAAVEQLGDFEIARLKIEVMNTIRTPSYTSLASRSDSEESATGPRISRGFTTSRTLRAAPTSKDRNNLVSRATSRATSPDQQEGTSGQLRPQSKRKSFLRFEVGPAPLATIDEGANTMQKKKSVPLIFDAQGMTDQVIDDDEYESCEESFAPKQVPAKAYNQGTNKGASNLQEKRSQNAHVVLHTKTHNTRQYRTFDHVSEKARVSQKKPTKPPARRLSTRSVKVLVNRAASKENVPGAVETKPSADFRAPASPINSPLPFAVFSPTAVPTSSEESVEGNPAQFGLYIAEPKTSRTTTIETGNVSNDASSVPQSLTQAVSHASHVSTSHGRQRSNTAIRVHSGNIPIIYVEDDVKQVPALREINRENRQPVAV